MQRDGNTRFISRNIGAGLSVGLLFFELIVGWTAVLFILQSKAFVLSSRYLQRDVRFRAGVASATRQL